MQTRLRDRYDWIVLGDHPGALLSASLAAKLGLSVLVVPLGTSRRAEVSRSGQVLDPEPNVLLGLHAAGERKPLLAECLARAGMEAVEKFLINGSVAPQALTPAVRLLLSPDLRDFQAAVEREFGKKEALRLGWHQALAEGMIPIQDFWWALPERLTWEMKKQRPATRAMTLSDLRSRLRRKAQLTGTFRKAWLASELSLSEFCQESGHSELSDVCLAFVHGSMGSPVWAVPALSQVLQALALGTTAAAFKGGMTAYRDFLLTLARRAGVHIAAKAECRRIFIENGRFAGIQVSSHGNMIGAGGGVLGSMLEDAVGLVTASGRAWGRKLKRSGVPSGWRFSVGMTVHAEAIPPGLSSRNVWWERGAPPLEIELADPADYGVADGEAKLLHMRTVLPFSPETLDPEYQRLIATRMLRRVTELIPFLEFHVTRIYPDFRNLSSTSGEPGDLEHVYGFRSLAQIPSNLRCYAGEGLGSSSNIDGLFLASEESFPELGSFGPTVAALEAVAWAAHRAGLAGPFA